MLKRKSGPYHYQGLEGEFEVLRKGQPSRSPWSFNIDPRRQQFDYREAYDPLQTPVTNTMEADDRFATRIAERYGPQRPLPELADSIRQDYGINPYKMIINLGSLKSDSVNGDWSGDSGRVRVEKKLQKETPAWAANTLFHEISHAANDFSQVEQQGANEKMDEEYSAPGEPGHFGVVKNRWDLARMLDEQARIEAGEKPDANRLAEYPWLKKVHPLSSNRLANPWTEKLDNVDAMPVATWNRQVEEKNPQLFPDVMEPDPTANPHHGMLGPDGRYQHAPISARYRRIRPGVFGQVNNAYQRFERQQKDAEDQESSIYPTFFEKK